MKKIICSLFLAVAVALVTSPVAFAADVVETEIIAISITLEGDPYVDVVTSDGGAVAWTVVLGETGWKAADNHLIVTYLLPANGGISINTQNAGDAAGLVGVADPDNVLSMAWRAVSLPADVSADIYAYYWNEEADGVNYNPVAAAGADGDDDLLDDYYKLTNADVKPDYPVWDLDGAGPNEASYACWIFMLDGPVSAMGDTDVTYSSPVTGAGIQHAEMSFGSWSGSPDYVSLAADFSKATPQQYTSALRVELYTE